MLQPAPRRTDRIAIVRNPRSGSAPETATLARAIRSSIGHATLLDAPAGAAFAPWLDRIALDYDVLVAAGGDGTVSSVASAAVRAGKTLAIIPTGTLNHFARDSGIPIDLDQAAAIVAGGNQRAIDVGTVNGHVFVNNVSLGGYPRMVSERDALERRGRSRPVAAAVAIARTWWQLGKLTVALSVDGRDMVRRSPFIVVGNGSYALSGLSLGKRDEISDGRLSLYIAPSTGRIGVLALPIRALTGTLERHEQFDTFAAESITAHFSRPRIEAAIDGEVRVLESPLRFEVRRAALRVLVP
jgi:diacylglycerol kinase family enzyme